MLYMLQRYVISCYHKEFSSMKCHSQWIKGISLWRHFGAASVGGCRRVHPCIRESEKRRAKARNISLQTLYDGQFTLSTHLIIPYYPFVYNVRQGVWTVLKNFSVRKNFTKCKSVSSVHVDFARRLIPKVQLVGCNKNLLWSKANKL